MSHCREDLACRWTTAELARTECAKDLKLRAGEIGFDDKTSNFTAMRMYQTVLQAKHIFPSGASPGAYSPVGGSCAGSNLDALCDRVSMEKDWTIQTGSPKPRLEYEGSDSFVKKQFRYCARGEIGYFAPKHIVSAEEGERPIKSHRKFTVDGFEKEEEEEEQPNPQTRRQLERMHLVFRNNLLMCILAFPQFKHFDVEKSDLDEWYDWFYGPSIAGRKPPPSETTLLRAECNAWRQIYQLIMADGASLKSAMKSLRDDHLFWSREVYERILFQQLRPGTLKGAREKGKEKARPEPLDSMGSTRSILRPRPWGTRAEEKAKTARKGGWPAAIPYCRDFHLKHSCAGNCNRSHACPVRINGWRSPS